jgi:hypothetical protein
MIARFREQHIPWRMLGDLIEAIGPLDKRFCLDTHKDSIMAQIEEATELIAPAARCLQGIHLGNHENKLSNSIGNISLDVFNRLKHRGLSKYCAFDGYFAFIRMRCPEGDCRMFTGHGGRSISFRSDNPDRDKVNEEIKLRRLLSRFTADLKVIAHFHKVIVAGPQMFTRNIEGDGFKIKRRNTSNDKSISVACPSFYKTYDDGDMPSYGEIAMYDPTDLGWIEVVLDREGQARRVEWRNEDGAIGQAWEF